MTFLEPNITDINLDTIWNTGTFINQFVTGIFLWFINELLNHKGNAFTANLIDK